jgi:ABC-type sugar transport system substrate-binding protein
MLSEAGGM